MDNKTNSGLYRGRVRIGVGANGKPINKYVSGHTKKEMEENKEYVRQHYLEGVPIVEDMMFWKYAETWYNVKKEPFISDASKKQYISMLRKYILPVFGERHLKAITAEDLQEFVNTFRGHSKSGITLAIGILKNIMSSAYAEGIIERDPTAALIRPKSGQKKERRALTPTETTNILATIRRHPQGLLLGVYYYLGVRRCEGLGLKWGDFDFKTNMVHIQRDIDFTGGKPHIGELKTKAANRHIPIPTPLREMLVKVRGLPDQFVFLNEKCEFYDKTTFEHIWLSLMEDAGCVIRTTDKNGHIHVTPAITAHYLRHNFVTMLYNAGVDAMVAMKIVGHTDYQTTANIYTHLDEETLIKSGMSLDAVFEKKKWKPNRVEAQNNTQAQIFAIGK